VKDTSCLRHDIAAFLTGAIMLVAEEALIGFGDRVFGIIAYNEALFV
jgi:hypothetical protein